ncbi:MAG TPA: ABC transporter ATP-binding protein [Ktedonobacterales bacterium]|nr:ABC transporter ATP-binding protein [Ktedonobacterales bacterium]
MQQPARTTVEETAQHTHPEGSLSAPSAITVESIAKRYGTLHALDGLSFTVGVGEVFALLGPNGAGKTTTVEILEGYRAPDGGIVRVLGLNPIRDGRRLKQQIGIMLQQDGLYPGLTAREALRLYAQFYERPADPEALLERVGLQSAAKTRCRQLSGGQKRRLALAVALVGKPTLVFLDEPTAGMDPQARLATWEIIRDLRREGATVLLTTHLMDEAEKLADRVAIIDHGKLVALDTPAALTGGAAAGLVRFSAPAGLDCVALAALPSAQEAKEVNPGAYTLKTNNASALLAELTAWLRDQNVTLTELRVGHGSLEEIFLQLTGKEVRL